MKKYGLSKTCLLRKTKEFEQVYKQGRRLYGDGFTLIYRRNDLGFNRLGISIHRQVKGAVKRNRIKRIIRESFRLHREVYPDDSDIVMAVKPSFPSDSPGAVVRAVSLLAYKGGVSDDN
ncbi:ribonuclease P protein component [Desulfopila inferna]|uniref:ribonuclease P protein component n=1 Tax=Desulfopila inferna TaxID=468528 RepID=UPI0019644129|nr:ribonuclease P protein component [Desulfopila inferna]MBM9605150.1 ribonuclease P protein component [Desulfopila inferna]